MAGLDGSLAWQRLPFPFPPFTWHSGPMDAQPIAIHPSATRGPSSISPSFPSPGRCQMCSP